MKRDGCISLRAILCVGLPSLSGAALVTKRWNSRGMSVNLVIGVGDVESGEPLFAVYSARPLANMPLQPFVDSGQSLGVVVQRLEHIVLPFLEPG